MDIWTKAQFKDQSYKFWSQRDGTIAEIDDKLEKYHEKNISADEKDKRLVALWTKVCDFEKEKAIKHSAAPGKQSKKRKNAVHTLRTQVEWHMWQRDYDSRQQDRDDLRDFIRKPRKKDSHDLVLRDMLARLKIQVKQGDPVTSQHKKDLHAEIEREFAPPFAGKRWHDEGVASGKYPWAASFGAYLSAPKFELPSNLRIATVDIESVLGDGAFTYLGMDFAKLTPADKSAMFIKIQAKDPMVGYLQSVNQVAEFMSVRLRGIMENYLRSLLKVDLELQSKLVQRALASKPGFKAVVHLDYYATRNVDQVGLHKDTNGNNLFAVLNYINEDPMLGPEYIDDPAPIKTTNPAWYKGDIWADLPGYTRSGAPWAEIAKDKYVWPDDLIWALQNVRMNPPNQDSNGKLASSILPKDGLVSFVDELIFHATPITGHRHDSHWAKETRYLHAGVSFPTLEKDGKNSGDILNLYEAHIKKDRVERRMSAHYDNGVHIETGLLVPGAKSGGVRKFFRLWICIVPEHWYQPNPAYT